ncbi:MAG: MopE-related protein [Myxococcota bacterium]
MLVNRWGAVGAWVLLLTVTACGGAAGGGIEELKGSGDADAEVSVDIPVAETTTLPDAEVSDGQAGTDSSDTTGGSDAPPGKGEPGAPCATNGDCFSGWCVEGLEGYICTDVCSQTCPAGFDCKGVQNLGDVVFLCLPRLKKLCTPCTQDIQCAGGSCLTLDGFQGCAFSCESATDCPVGWECAADAAGVAQGTFCQPETGSCSCNAEVDGGQRTCTRESASGMCFGVETCSQETGWSGCSALEPSPEICDGLDNDCNGLADDGLTEGEACAKTNKWGECSGVLRCVGAQGWICNAREPQAEVCNQLDDDCDSELDETFKDADGAWTLDAHCGTCGNVCTDKFPNATGVCGGPAGTPYCVIDTCAEGLVKVSDFLCTPPVDAACAPCASDADCFSGSCVLLDGQNVCVSACADGACGSGFDCEAVADGVERCVPTSGSCTCNAANQGAKRTCVTPNVFGSCFGVETCDSAAGWTGCTAKEAAAEVCDGADNDCNGLIDDGVVTGVPCTNEVAGVGSCDGTLVCLGSQGEVCQGPKPEAEICDFKDNNCDGAVDEAFTTGGVYNTFEHCGTCNLSCAIGFPNAESTTCQVAGGQAQCVVLACKPGFVKLNPFQCIPDAVNTCQACAADENCLGEGAGCTAIGEGTFCTAACTVEADCDAGFVCQDVGKASKQCVPASGSCTCDGTNTDLSRACAQIYTPPNPALPAYTCKGTQQCTTAGWGSCDVPSELCDGLDNNCDGTIDETYKDASGAYTSVQHCGGCNISCLALAVPNADPSCSTSSAVPTCSFKCKGGYEDVDGLTDNGCECLPMAGEDLAGDGVDSNCDGIDGDLHGAIFVAKNGDNNAPGSREEPMLTISAALQRAFATGKRDVYVATGVYSENVVLIEGIGLFGGYSSDFFRRNTVTFETAIIGQDPTSAAPGAVTAVGLGGTGAAEATILDGFTVFGANAANVAGANSYAVYLRNVGAKVEVRKNRIFGGAGGNGIAGAPGVDGFDGPGGGAGLGVKDVGKFGAGNVRTCSDAADSLVGGAGGARICADGAVTNGGGGGAGLCPVFAGAPVAAEKGLPGTGPSAGTGGLAGWDSIFETAVACGTCGTPPNNNSYFASFGTSGGSGADGAAGAGCSGAGGLVVGGHWVGGTGAAGGASSHGSGGGGGGAGSGVEVTGTGCGGGAGAPAPADCCASKSGGGCSSGTVTSCVCANDSFCCNVQWDVTCAEEVASSAAATAAGSTAKTSAARAAVAARAGAAGPRARAASPAAAASASSWCATTAAAGSRRWWRTCCGRAAAVRAAPAARAARAAGGAGAAGGSPSEGDPSTWCATGGAEGGNGGRGGHGGGGGGGCGGASYGIFASPAPTGAVKAAWLANQFLPGGFGGQGGFGGPSLGASGTPGQAGLATQTNF